MSNDTDCICAGNWRKIVEETEPKIGKPFRDKNGKTWILFGIVHGGDDYYYGMHRAGIRLRLLSCVGSLEAHGYEAEDC